MIRARLDRLFERFCRDGDAAALGKVFDAAAPLLWRVASHLCGNRHEAEDAVQNTFLSAIEAKASWDRTRVVDMNRIVEETASDPVDGAQGSASIEIGAVDGQATKLTLSR